MSNPENEEYVRHCTSCDKEMFEGYCVCDGMEYFCSDECRDYYYSEQEWTELLESDNAYWTEWERESEVIVFKIEEAKQ